MSPLLGSYHEFLENVTIGTTNDATFPTKVGVTTCNTLIDMGATRSVMSKNYYQTIMLPQIKHLDNVSVRLASGRNFNH